MKRSLLFEVLEKQAAVAACDAENNQWEEEEHLNNSNVLDCSEIGSCLKRVKISVSSPGEIRLSNDFEHLIHQCGWSKKFVDGSNFCYQDPSKRIFVTRDPVDLLRLKLVHCLREEEEWIFYLRFPRMYPHSAPEIYRLFKRTCSNNIDTYTNTSFCKNHNSHLLQQIASTSSIAAQIQIRQSWTPRRRCSYDYNDCNNNTSSCTNNTKISMEEHQSQMDVVTNAMNNVRIYQCNEWTPIRRLHDLIGWLTQLPYYCSADQDSEDIMTDAEKNEDQVLVKHLNLCSRTGSMESFGNNTCNNTTTNNNNINDCMMIDHLELPHQQQHSSPCMEDKKQLWLFDQTRFDVGFVPSLYPQHHQNNEDMSNNFS